MEPVLLTRLERPAEIDTENGNKRIYFVNNFSMHPKRYFDS